MKNDIFSKIFVYAGVSIVLGSVGACEAELYSLLQCVSFVGIGFFLIYAGKNMGEWR